MAGTCQEMYFKKYIFAGCEPLRHTRAKRENEDEQGRNQVCSQRWARLQNFPHKLMSIYSGVRGIFFRGVKVTFSDFSQVKISILVHPKQISVVSKDDQKKKKKKKKRGSSAHFSYLPLPF